MDDEYLERTWYICHLNVGSILWQDAHESVLIQYRLKMNKTEWMLEKMIILIRDAFNGRFGRKVSIKSIYI